MSALNAHAGGLSSDSAARALSPEPKRLKTAGNGGTDVKVARLLAAPSPMPSSKMVPSAKPKPTNRVLMEDFDLASESKNPLHSESSLVFGSDQYIGDDPEARMENLSIYVFLSFFFRPYVRAGYGAGT